MVQTIKILKLAAGASEIKEVGLQEAERIVKEAYLGGNLVVNKRVGEVIDKITPDVEEIVLVEIAAGG